ncbi:hypothetical protein [Gordonia tangerina]|uniref:Uncharacterized protein n=1 Tax=Gordonia tangerina TaxID=2911060 RepID=A0ABS9DL06_9ACTN|nr:hypothetical protein [Gordonia tangerina]MCF3939920.1 hypothetical protein [Gordonia tangerina]
MKYLMWFSRYGSTEVREEYDITDCYDLELMRYEADTAVVDQYGVLCEVEEITFDGVGRVIPLDEWEQGLKAYKAKMEQERTQSEVNNPRPKPYGEVLVYPPYRSVASWVSVSTAYNRIGLAVQAEQWASQIGDARVKTRVFGGNT